MTLLANDGIQIQDDLTTSGALTVDADVDAGDVLGTFLVDAGAAIDTSNQVLSVTANELTLSGTLNSGLSATNITDSDGSGLLLGTGTLADSIVLDNAELVNITASELTLTTAGDAQVSGATQTATIDGAVILVASGATSSITFDTSSSSFRTLSASASEGITVSADLSTSVGEMNFNADSDADDNSGVFSIDAGITVDSNDQAISITSDDLNLAGAIDSGDQSVTINDSDGTGIGLGGTTVLNGIGLDGGELSRIIATDLGLNTTGDILVDSVTATQSDAIAGTVSLTSGDLVDFSGSSTFNALTVAAENQIQIAGNLTSDTGDLNLDADSNDSADTDDNMVFASNIALTSAGFMNLDARSGLASASGTLQLTAADGITIGDNLTTAGELTINADTDANDQDGTLVISSGVGVVSTDSQISITANDVDLLGSIDAGTAALIVSGSDSDGIGLGDTAISDGLNLSSTELSQITATNASIQSLDLITVDNVTATSSNGLAGTTTLSAETTIEFSGTASTFNGLQADAKQGISVDVDLTTDTSNLRLDGDADSVDSGADAIQFANGVQLVSGGDLQLSASNGDLSAAGTLTLEAVSGITINDSLTTTGSLSVDADTDLGATTGVLTLAASANLETADQTISIRADDLVLGGLIDSGTAATTITETDGDGITLGDATTVSGMSVDGVELAQFNASGVTFETAGSIEVDNVFQSATITGAIVLLSESTISFLNQSSTFRGLSADADDGIDVGVSVTTTQSSLALDGNEDAATDTLDDIQFASGVVLTSAGSISLASSGNTMTGDGALSLLANDGVSIDDSLTTVSTLTINADVDATDNDGTLTVASGATVSATNLAISVTANDLDLRGNLGTAGTVLTLTDSDANGIGLGGVSATDGLNVTGTELERIFAQDLTVSTGGDLFVDGISSANSNNISGLVELDSSGQITFTANASIFQALDVNADNGVLVNSDLQTDAGLLDLDGDSNSSADGTDDISIAAGVTLESALTLTLKSQSGEIVAAGALNLRSADGITLEDSLTTSGNLTIDADTDAGDENGTFSLLSGANVSSGSSTIDITANDLSLLATLDSGAAETILRDSDGSGVGLGDSTVTDGLNLADSELDLFTSSGISVLTIGDVLVDNVSQPMSITGTFAMTASGATSSVAFQNSASSFDGLTVNASDGVTFDVNVTTTAAITIDADTDASDNDGNVRIALGATLSSGNQNIDVTADEFELLGSLDAGSGDLSLTDSDGEGIGLGDTTVTNGLNLTGSELSQITAANAQLTTSGVIEVDNITAANSNTISGTTQLTSAQTVTFSANDAIFNDLVVDADRGISINGSLETDSGDLVLDGDANNADDTTDPNDNIVFAAGAQVTSAGLLSLAATTGGMSSAGALTLQAADGITLNDSLTTAGQLDD